MSHEKRAPGYLLYRGDEILPGFMAIILNQGFLLNNQYNGK